MIPKTAHFIWFGREFPWIYGFAAKTAAQQGGFERVVIHHADDIDETPGGRLAGQTRKVEFKKLDPEAALEGVEQRGPALVTLYRKLTQPAARANMVRAAILAREGGVYLDTDTITIGSFEALLGTGVFCGVEHIALPRRVAYSRSPIVWAKAALRLGARDVCRRLPMGWRLFRYLERAYFEAVNNAVFGAAPSHAFVLGLLDMMTQLPEKESLRRFALGTHLLATEVEKYRGDDLVVHGPKRFYPLAPEVSEHWFKKTKNPRPDDVLTDGTVCVHWYASVRTKKIVPLIDENYVRANAPSQMLSALALRYL